MNQREENKLFRNRETDFVAQTELDALLLPLHVSRGALVGKGPVTPQKDSLQTRFKHWYLRCIEEERAYRGGFLFVPVLIAAGAAFWFWLPATPPSLPLLIATLCVMISAAALYHRPGASSIFLKTVALLLLGMVLADWDTQRSATIILDTPVTTLVKGTVERRELDARGNWRYVLALTSTSNPTLSRPPDRVSVVARSRHQAAEIGETITGKARLSPPSGPALPGLNDFAFASFFEGIGATGFFYGPPQRLSADPSPVPASGPARMAGEWLYELRSDIAQRIRYLIPGDAGAFAASIVTDERRAISGETMEALRVSGLAHIVAISGLNMALAAGIFFVGMRTVFSLFPGFSQRWPVKKISAFAALLMTFAYYLISGFAVSAERAWLMMSIMLIAVLVDRPSISLRNVALSALIIVVLSPHEVMGPSFQMSFAATLALVSAYSFWSRWRNKEDSLSITNPPWWLTLTTKSAAVVGGVALTSFIGGLSTAVYSIEHFHRITTYGLAANLAAMPVMSLIVMPFGLAGMLLMPFGLDGPFLKIMGYGMEIVIEIAKTVSSWGGDATIGRQHPWFLTISTIGFLLLSLLRTRLALIGVPFIAAGLIMLGTERWSAKPDLLIFEDGSLIALLSKDTVATTKARASGFIYDQWERAVPLTMEHVAPHLLDTERQADGDTQELETQQASRSRLSEADKTQAMAEMKTALAGTQRFTCRKDLWCALKSQKGVRIAVLSNTLLTGAACDLADIVVTSRGVPFPACRSGALLITGDTLRRTGSMEIWFGGEGAPRYSAKAALDGIERPWTAHRSYQWRSKTYDATLPEHIAALLSAER